MINTGLSARPIPSNAATSTVRQSSNKASDSMCRERFGWPANASSALPKKAALRNIVMKTPVNRINRVGVKRAVTTVLEICKVT